jgi:hypothetical protein
MRELRSFGSVRGEGGNVLTYSEALGFKRRVLHLILPNTPRQVFYPPETDGCECYYKTRNTVSVSQ